MHLIISIGAYAIINEANYKNEKDSVSLEIIKCKTDSCKGKILKEMFWNYRFINLEHAKFYADWIWKDLSISKDSSILYDVYFIKGEMLLIENNPDSAKIYFEKALSHSIQIMQRAWCYYQLGRINNILGYYAKAKAHMQNSIACFEECNDSYQAEAAKDILANTYQLHNEYDSLFLFQDKRLELYRKNKDNVAEVKLYWHLASTYTKLNNAQKTMEYFNKALSVAEENRDSIGIANIYCSIGDLFVQNKQYHNIAIDYYSKGLEYFNSDFHQARYYRKMGELNFTLNEDSIAFDFYTKCLEITKKKAIEHLLPAAHYNLALYYKKVGKYQLALNQFEKSIENACTHCTPIKTHLAIIEMADLYLKTGKPEKAYRYYSEALSVAMKYRGSNEITLSHLKLGNYFATSMPKLAKKHYLAALKAAEKDFPMVKTIADTLSSFFQQEEKYKLAYKYESLARSIVDTLSASEIESGIASLAMKFEFDKLEHENEINHALSIAKLKKQKIYRNSFLAIAILFAILGIVIYNSYHRKKKDNVLLTTQKKLIEERNLEIVDQIEEITIQRDKIERISSQLHEADQKRIQFFTNISHELRTPLTLILGPIEKLIKDYIKNPRALSLLEVMQRNTFQLYKLINQLLDIRKLDTSNVKLCVEKGNIISFCEALFSAFNYLAKEKSIHYTYTANIDAPMVWFDRDVIEKSLNNLLSNAIRHTPINGEIRLYLSYTSGSPNQPSPISLIVSNTGKGIPEDQIQYVFDRYYQVENTNTGFNTGTGIGLAYTKELIELHKGEIQIESNSNSGTRFMISLSVDESDYSNNEKAEQLVVEKKAEIKNFEHKYTEQIIGNHTDISPKTNKREIDYQQSILIVEDHLDLRGFIRNIFEKEFAIYEAPDGKEALKMAEELIPDLIISDIMMPNMNGLALCQKLKQEPHTCHIPIVLLTAKAGYENELEGITTGADDYICKPFNTDILVARVRSLLALKKNIREHFSLEFLIKPKDITIAKPEDEFILKAVKIVEDHISDPELNVEILLKKLGVSRTQLFRKLKAVTNYTPREFIRNMRLQRAAQLLTQNALNMSEVLDHSGFSNQTYFKNCFTKMYGCSPKEYASRNK